MSDEEKKALERIDYIQDFIIENGQYNADVNDMEYFSRIVNLIEKQSKEIEDLKETLKCTQNSWFEDTQKIEEMKKQIDLNNECEIALNSKVMDLEKEIEELKLRNEALGDITIYNQKNSVSKDKIKAKIEEIDIEIQQCEYADDDTEEYKKDIEKEKRRLLRDKAVLQSLLEKE